MNAIEELAESFSRLPGIGKKSAMRISYHLLKSDPTFTLDGKRAFDAS